jgi:hypothetical protein
MKTELNKLNETELLKLKADIDSQLEIIEQEKNERKITKTKMCDLTRGDKIFCIQYVDSLSKINFIGYCDIEQYIKYDKSDYHDIIVTHKTDVNKYIKYDETYNNDLQNRFIGFTTSLHENRSNKHYMLNFTPTTITLLTLKPETWEDDLIKGLTYKTKQRTIKHNKDMMTLINRIESFQSNKEIINKNIADKNIK